MVRSVVGLVWLALAAACGGSVEKPRRDVPASSGASATGGASGSAGAASSGGESPAATGGAASSGAAQVAGAPNSAGEGGSSPEAPCGGIEPWCEPGESVCDPVLGVRTTCSECSEPLPNPSGSPCVRLLASDKESNGICVVVGQTSLQCWSGWGEPRRGAVPRDTTQVLPPDDFSSLQSLDPLTLCTRRGASDVSCLGNGCTRVAIGDYGACGICNGQLSCTGQLTAPAVLPQPLLDVAVTDGIVFVLGGSAIESTFKSLVTPTFAQGKALRLLLDHYEAGCVLSDHDELACVERPVAGSFVESPWRGPFRKFVLQTMPQACVLGMDRRLRCGDVLRELEQQPYALENVIDIVASSSLICGLTLDGHVQCWGASGQLLEMPADW